MIQPRRCPLETVDMARYLAAGAGTGVVGEMLALLHRIQRCLADEAMWAEPRSDLVEEVVEPAPSADRSP